MMKVLELKGPKSLRAYNVFSTLMMGLNMLPAYLSTNFNTFLDTVAKMPHQDQLKILLEATRIVELNPDEVAAVMLFCCDKNGVPFTKENINNLGPAEIIEGIVSVCGEIAKIKVDFITEGEKKNLETSQ